MASLQPPFGHVFRVERSRGPVWYAEYLLPDGRQVQKKIGPAWSERGRPPAGYFTRRQAEAWLEDVLHAARRGTLPGRSGAGSSSLRRPRSGCVSSERTASGSRRRLSTTSRRCVRICCPAFGDRELESITPEEIELWRRGLKGLSNRSKNKLLIQLHGIFRRAQIVWNVPVNPLARVEKHPMRPSGDIQVFSPEEVWALVRASASEQDGVLFLTAAFTGLRMGELLALRWRDVDFAGSTIRVRASYAGGALDDAEVRQGASGPDGPGRRDCDRRAQPPPRLGRRRRPGVPRRVR